jgi:hypothetical protein
MWNDGRLFKTFDLISSQIISQTYSAVTSQVHLWRYKSYLRRRTERQMFMMLLTFDQRFFSDRNAL